MPSDHRGIFTPATRLLQSMPIAGKFLLILLVFIIPLGYLSWGSVQERQQQIGFFQQQLQGLEQLGRAYPLLPLAMQIRDTEYPAAFGYAVAGGDPAEAEQQLQQTLQALAAMGSSASQHQLAEIHRLRQTRQQAKAAPLQRHSQASAIQLAMRQYLQRLAEEHGVLLGHDLLSYQLAHIGVDTLPYGLDLSSALRGLGTGILARGSFSPESYIQLNYYAGELGKTLNTLQHAYQATAQSHMGQLALYQQASQTLAQAEGFLQLTHSALIDPESLQTTAQDYARQGEGVFRALQALHGATVDALGLRLRSSIARLQWQRDQVLLISALITLLMLYLFAAFYYAMKPGIEQINQSLAAIAQGDFERRAEVRGRDEIRTIADNLNHTAAEIKKLVRIAYS